MKILFFGDSITDALRFREFQSNTISPNGLGSGYVNAIASNLVYTDPNKYEIINSGIGGNRSVDLFARIKIDCWNYKPDVLSILVGVNDVWHEDHKNGVSIGIYEKIYTMIVEETIKVLPNIKIMLLEPFFQIGSATIGRYEEFCKVFEYADVVRKIAKDHNLPFVELQKPLDEYAKKFGNDKTLADGVHPAIAGCKVIADEWIKVFKEKIDIN